MSYKDLNSLFDEILKSGLFDFDYYKNQFDEQISENLLTHYLKIGYMEGKNPSKKFNGNFYLNNYPDVRNCGMNPLIHYVLFGKNQNFKINPEVKFNPVCTRLLTRDIFDKMVKEDKYYEGRWEYVEDIIMELSKFNDSYKILEMGPYKLPIVEGEDVIDVKDFSEFYPIQINKFIKHDCSNVPYPIKDKEYDLVIACQVLEHLGIYGQQMRIFDELERICKKAIISLPYKWFIPNMRDHHMIDENVISHWAKGRKPAYQSISGSRIIQIYEFD